MLNVWVNYPEDEEKLIGETKTVFADYADLSVLDTDLGIIIIKDTSSVTEIVDSRRFVTMWGFEITPEKLSVGAKILLLMLSEKARLANFIYSYTFCGDNCDKYVEEIANMYDVNLYLSRFYIPFYNGVLKIGVKFMESGVVVNDYRSFLHEYCRLEK